MVNTDLADVSNAALISAIMAYGFAMLAYACDFLYGKNILDSPLRPNPSARRTREGKGGRGRSGRGGCGAVAEPTTWPSAPSALSRAMSPSWPT